MCLLYISGNEISIQCQYLDDFNLNSMTLFRTFMGEQELVIAA